MADWVSRTFVAVVLSVALCAAAEEDETAKLEREIEKAEEIISSLRSVEPTLEIEKLRKMLKSEAVATLYDKYSGEKWADFMVKAEQRISAAERNYKRNSRPKSMAGGMAEVIELTLAGLKKQRASLAEGDAQRKELGNQIADYEKRLDDERKAMVNEKAENEKRQKAASEARNKELLGIKNDVASNFEQKVVRPMKARLESLNQQREKMKPKKDNPVEGAARGGGQLEVVRNVQGMIVGLMGCVLGEGNQFDDFTFGEKVKEGRDIGDDYKTFVYELQKQIYGFTHVRLSVSGDNERLMSIHLLAPVENSNEVNRKIEEIKGMLQDGEQIIFSSVKKGDNGYLECRSPSGTDQSSPVTLCLEYEYEGESYFAQGAVFGARLNTSYKAASSSQGNVQVPRADTGNTATAESSVQDREQREKAADELTRVSRAKSNRERIKLIRQAMYRYAKLEDIKGVAFALSALLDNCDVVIPDVYEVMSSVAAKSSPDMGKKIKELFQWYHGRHTEEYERKKEWYHEQLRYNAVDEVGFYRCENKKGPPSYGINLHKRDASWQGAFMEIWLIGGHVSYPASMAYGFAEKLIAARIFIYNYENPRANLEAAEKAKREAAEKAEEEKRRKANRVYAPKKRRINPDLKRFKGPGDR